ncbi:hypothetical protein [Streptomyces sp. NBC_01262]|uniref:hypothetical protein n=1 Tax=Streptomyces sp. NBC_01262 TaxID=2903803 RepID=UPI002E337437|nr:hypothetical protein [Streptomyces sp. NBC_01262]
MGPGTIPHPARRTWTIEVRPHPDGPVLVCPQCHQIPTRPGTAAVRTSIVTHLAQHARTEWLAPHLRTCRCGEHGCRWHGRHRGCDGPVLLVLSRDRSGRAWRLADVCGACTAATTYAAAVTEPGDAPAAPAGTTRPGAPLPHPVGGAAAVGRSAADASGGLRPGAAPDEEASDGCDLLEESSWWVDGLAYG